VKKRNYIVAFAAVASVVLSGCYYDIAEELYPGSICDTTAVTFSGSVNGILQQNCISCHNSSITSGNVNLEGFSHVNTYVQNGRLIGTITHSAGFIPMPQGAGKLSDCEIATIQRWVNNGTQNN
jgi:hypothetical protein